jgi:hypothetical protein
VDGERLLQEFEDRSGTGRSHDRPPVPS